MTDVEPFDITGKVTSMRINGETIFPRAARPLPRAFRHTFTPGGGYTVEPVEVAGDIVDVPADRYHGDGVRADDGQPDAAQHGSLVDRTLTPS